MPPLRTCLYWVGLALTLVALTLATGAAVGGVFWAALGPWLGSETDLAGRLASGASVGVRYARVWAGGLAIVACFMKAHSGFSFRVWWRERRRASSDSSRI